MNPLDGREADNDVEVLNCVGLGDVVLTAEVQAAIQVLL